MPYSELQLEKFFNEARNTYQSYANSSYNNLQKFFTSARVEYKAFKKIKREIDRYLFPDF